ncbi:MAG TPA: YtxH domain-containing protein [Terriglobales bacterium]|nr:YtxH domain-containing protein [Terriglobales bacterium]
MKQLAKLLLSTGLLLVDSDRRSKAADSVKDRVDDWTDTAKDKFEDAMDRLERVAYAARGKTPWTSKAGGFLLGMGIGVGVGMLFAPSSGEEMRNSIRDRATDIRDRVSTQASNLRDRVSEQTSNLKDRMRETTSGGGENERISRPA